MDSRSLGPYGAGWRGQTRQYLPPTSSFDGSNNAIMTTVTQNVAVVVVVVRAFHGLLRVGRDLSGVCTLPRGSTGFPRIETQSGAANAPFLVPPIAQPGGDRQRVGHARLGVLTDSWLDRVRSMWTIRRAAANDRRVPGPSGEIPLLPHGSASDPPMTSRTACGSGISENEVGCWADGGQIDEPSFQSLQWFAVAVFSNLGSAVFQRA